MRLPRVRFTMREYMVTVAVVGVVTAWLFVNINWDWSPFSPSKPFCSVTADL